MDFGDIEDTKDFHNIKYLNIIIIYYIYINELLTRRN